MVSYSEVYLTIPCEIAPFEKVVIIVTKSFNCPTNAKPLGPTYIAKTLFIINADITVIIVDIAVKTEVLIKVIY
jgi:hypothetical protein